MKDLKSRSFFGYILHESHVFTKKNKSREVKIKVEGEVKIKVEVEVKIKVELK